MGHTQMLLAVAGLDDWHLQDRVRKLASGDWSSFRPAERAGFYLARKLTREPWTVQPADIAVLQAHWGREHALDAIWYMCWCNYMTRVADAFQLPLEHDNVFSSRPQSRFPSLSNAETWKRLPPALHGKGQRLPQWARVLAASLPQTTAAMLELDYWHRVRSPLNARLRGEIRWVAAHAIGCQYGQAYAAADLRRVGMKNPDSLARPSFLNDRPAAEKAALVFARKLTLASDTITDEEVTYLIRQYGEKIVVAMVQLIAYANFLDRMTLALGLTVEPGGPRQAVDVRFARSSLDIDRALVPGGKPFSPPPPKGVVRIPDHEWGAVSLATLQQAMHQQQTRKPRIRLPGTDPGDVRWGLVGRTYQPQLHRAWVACSSTFQRESDQDPALEARLLWVITRTVRCFY
jgi:alkylhydroperoxidase family enzyme